MSLDLLIEFSREPYGAVSPAIPSILFYINYSYSKFGSNISLKLYYLDYYYRYIISLSEVFLLSRYV
jgi:hypothetical protein